MSDDWDRDVPSTEGLEPTEQSTPAPLTPNSTVSTVSDSQSQQERKNVWTN